MKLFTLLTTFLFSFSACASEDVYSKYPVNDIYKGKFFKLVYDEDQMSLEYYNTTKEELAKGVGFAGRYVVTIINIPETKAIIGLVVDVETGKDYEFPHVYGVDDQMFFDAEYKKNSSVMCISHGWKKEREMNQPKCYNFKDGKFIKIN